MAACGYRPDATWPSLHQRRSEPKANGAPFMGLADGPSLLWRLGLRSVSGLPCAEVAQHASCHFANGSNPFGESHLAMLAAALRDRMPSPTAAIAWSTWSQGESRSARSHGLGLVSTGIRGR